MNVRKRFKTNYNWESKNKNTVTKHYHHNKCVYPNLSDQLYPLSKSLWLSLINLSPII